MAVAPFAQGLDVFQRGVLWCHRLATDPAGHDAVQLAGHGFVDLVAGKAICPMRVTGVALTALAACTALRCAAGAVKTSS